MLCKVGSYTEGLQCDSLNWSEIFFLEKATVSKDEVHSQIWEVTFLCVKFQILNDKLSLMYAADLVRI